MFSTGNANSSKFATEYLEYSKDNYWTGEKLLKQVIEKAIPTFEAAFPGHVAVFLFDNATNHVFHASDALLVNSMNLNPGGKNTPIMRDGINSATGQPQAMVFPEDHPLFPGIPKGIKQVLLERRIWHDGLRLQCKSKCKEEGISSISSLP